MTIENISNTGISRNNVIEKLREKPQTFYELLGEFGISRNLNEKGSYCKEYIKLLNIISILETPITTRNCKVSAKPIITCAKKVDEKSFVLYLTEDEKKLMKLGKVRATDEQVRISINEYKESLKHAKKTEGNLFVPTNR